MDAYRQFVCQFEEALGAALPVPNLANFPRPPRAVDGAPVVLLFSPHPDDEVITGALPLRLQRELGARVVNIAVTLGSKAERRAGRRRELEKACQLLGWECEIHGWTELTPEAMAGNVQHPQNWQGSVVEIIERWQPRWIFYPHADDAHPTHMAVHLLVAQAVRTAKMAQPAYLVQTEYWRPLARPNLLVECAPDSLALLVAALCCHEGEIARNPYHLTLPAWMADNVRRGAELVGGPGAAAPTFRFGVLYRVEPELPPGWGSLIPAHSLAKN